MGLALLVLSARASVALEVHTISHWSGGFQVQVDIPVCKELDGWKAHVVFDQDVDTLEVSGDGDGDDVVITI